MKYRLMDFVVMLTREGLTSCEFLLVRVRIQFTVSSTLGEIQLGKKREHARSEENGTVTKLIIEKNNQLPTGLQFGMFKNKTVICKNMAPHQCS